MCYLMNPKTMELVKVRALHDSGSNTSLVTRCIVAKANLSGNPISLMMNVAGNETIVTHEAEVVFCLVNLDRWFCSGRLVATRVESIGAAFPAIPIDVRKFDHLKGITFTEKYPGKNERPFQVLILEP